MTFDGTPYTASSFSCSPFSLVFDHVDVSCDGGGSDVTFTFTCCLRYSCDGMGGCSDVGCGSGTYATTAACLAACNANAWACDHATPTCNYVGAGGGSYSSEAACLAACYFNDCASCSSELKTTMSFDLPTLTEASCGDCSSMSGAHADMSYTLASCQWQNINSDSCTALAIGNLFNTGGTNWELDIGDAVYTCSSFSCTTGGTFSYSSDGGSCTGWPGTITVTGS